MVLIDLLLGLGIFLFGMMQLERSIESLANQWIKQWLARGTNNPIGSVLSGTVITAIMQSSSLVGLIVLAFASAGIIPLYNAIGVLLGANLGTTFTGWIVTTLGFKLNLATIALPAIGLGCLIQVVAEKYQKVRNVGSLLFAFGLLLFGLGMMKDSVSSLPELINIEHFKNQSTFIFLLIGIVLTAIIQSSSAAMMIALAALNGGLIDLSSAAALVIGADLGTTSTTVLGSLKGSSIKLQLALSHVVFNLTVDSLAYFLLLPILPSILLWFDITDPLYSLVAFHSIFNVLGLFIFVPFLRQYTEWIGRCFVGDKEKRKSNLSDVPIAIPEAALSACQAQVKILLLSALALNMRNLDIDNTLASESDEIKAALKSFNFDAQSFEKRYAHIKYLEGDLLHYTMRLQRQALSKNQADQIIRLLDCSRDAVYGVKALKDIRSNLMTMRHSTTPLLIQFSDRYQQELKPFYKILLVLLLDNNDASYSKEQFLQLHKLNEQLHQDLHRYVQNPDYQHTVEPEDLSNLLNANREIWFCGQHIIRALENWYGL